MESSILRCSSFTSALEALGLPGATESAALAGSIAEQHDVDVTQPCGPVDSLERYLHERDAALFSSSRIAREAVRDALGPARSPGEAVATEEWLVRECAMHLAGTGRVMGASWTPQTLGLQLIECAQRGPDFEGALLDLLGESAFDLMAELVRHRSALARFSMPSFVRACKAFAAEAELVELMSSQGSSVLGRRAAPRFGAGVTVQSESALEAEKRRLKLENKLDRGLAKQQVTGAGLAFTAAESSALEPTVAAARRAPQYGAAVSAGGPGAAAGKRETVDEAIASVGAGHGGLQQVILPEGTVTTQHEGWQEVQVPAPAPPPVLPGGVGLVAIASLEPLAQMAFAGVTQLNRLQSHLFSAAYRSNENLLVCAPTGAGKTNVAMLAVCRELLQHVQPGGRHVRKDEFKIVYVAPMKALAAEVVDKFSERLSRLGLVVRELTGDMQLTKKEIEETQIIVTTPEKWDVITRKAGDGSLVSLVRLLIIDEVHLLADERGAVIESIVARTLRLVETSQSVIRIVGLSATLPNYADVASFLRVTPRGLFHFDASFRPVPLTQCFVGVSEHNSLKKQKIITKVAFDKAVAAIRRGKQVMVFVHSRKDTVKTAREFIELATEEGQGLLRLLSPLSGEEVEATDTFYAASGSGAALTSKGHVGAVKSEGRLSLTEAQWATMQREIGKSRNADLRELFPKGFGIHHAGMLRGDRTLTERMFAAGAVKILVCTATLAWGVNLPAHTVIIKGTQIYNPEAGGFTDLGVLDVTQIFGRAGRPQFDVTGEGIIITSHDKLPFYLKMLTHQMPIESRFIKALPDHLNAEIVSGTVSNLSEAVTWLGYTYLYERMLRNPMAYGILLKDKAEDPLLDRERRRLLLNAIKRLDECRMIRFDERSGNLAVTDVGRIASHYYLHNSTIFTFNERLAGKLAGTAATDADALNLICSAHEFDQIKVRDEEIPELDLLRGRCRVPFAGDVASTGNKVNVLLQAYIGGLELRGFTLISDRAYIQQSAGRISRALFEIFLRKGNCELAERFLALSKSIDKQLWWHSSPLYQFAALFPSQDVLRKLCDCGVPLDELCDMTASELGALVHHPNVGQIIHTALQSLPYVSVEATVQPLTRSVLRLTLRLHAEFRWSDRASGIVEPWWVWIEDAENNTIYHSEYVMLHKKQVLSGEPVLLVASIPVFEPLPSQYWVRVVSDRWLGLQTIAPVNFRHILLPQKQPPHTDLLLLSPLPVTALRNASYERIYAGGFTHFNPVQTQAFFALYRTDENVLLGAPTGSGKTIAGELAIFRLLSAHPGAKAVYIAPIKALVAERVLDWQRKFTGLQKTVVELTGDNSPDASALRRADIVITTPEKFDGVSRGWQHRSWVKDVGVVIIDEVHLLGEERGPVLEVIVSRLRYMANATGRPVRFVALSTALANAKDVGDWLGVTPRGMFNFRPSVRPVPMEAHIQGFPGKHYCPRMASMNKPVFASITTYSPDKPALVFVASRRQTRLTALELISLCAAGENPKRFLHMTEEEADALCALRVRDDALKHTLAFGIGIHHAGLCEGDRTLVEELFLSKRIQASGSFDRVACVLLLLDRCEPFELQILVCTATLAWGINLPARLVVVKGTEYFDASLSRYVDMPVTDVLQMMGRAGRPQFDTSGVAVILCQEDKKNYYRKFLYEPFPVESQLCTEKGCIADHLNAEVAGGSIRSRRDAVEFLTWTYFSRRLSQNPAYYGLDDCSPEGVEAFLFHMVDSALASLQESGCVLLGDDALVDQDLRAAETRSILPVDDAVAPTTLGRLASFYYLKHESAGLLLDRLGVDDSPAALLRLLCDCHEFDELPVRHNEDELNAGLALLMPWPAVPLDYSSPHVKAFLLLQARLVGAPLPISDYETDTKGVLDQSLRVLNAMVDVAADMGLVSTAFSVMRLVQCVVQARFPTDHPFQQLPGFSSFAAAALASMLRIDDPESALLSLVALPSSHVREALTSADSSLSAASVQDLSSLLRVLPSPGALRWRLSHSSGDLPVPSKGAAVTLPRGCTRLRLIVSLSSPLQRRAYAPKFGKPKEWGWWLVVTTEASTDLTDGTRAAVANTAADLAAAPSVPVAADVPVLVAVKRIGCSSSTAEHALDLDLSGAAIDACQWAATRTRTLQLQVEAQPATGSASASEFDRDAVHWQPEPEGDAGGAASGSGAAGGRLSSRRHSGRATVGSAGGLGLGRAVHLYLISDCMRGLDRHVIVAHQISD